MFQSPFSALPRSSSNRNEGFFVPISRYFVDRPCSRKDNTKPI